MSKVTRLKTRDSAAEPKDYKGTIQSTALEAALDEQREVAWEVEMLLRLAAHALEDISDKIGGINYTFALHRAAGKLANLADGLEAGPLEDRAIEIAQAREADAAGGAA